MSDWLTQMNYVIMIVQVAVSFVLVPLFSYKILLKTAKTYGLNRFPSASENVETWLNKSGRFYWLVVAITFVIASGMVLHAIFTQTELLNWDDQSGLMILYLLSMIPVIIMVLMHRSLFGIFKTYAGNKRTASLKVRSWKDYVSMPLLLLIAAANLVFIATVTYFVQHPFDGFAGYTNLIGLFVINLVFTLIIIFIYRDNKTNGLQQPEQRDYLKRRTIQVNMLFLAFALCHISLSIWIQGTGLMNYKLIVQSLYFQIILVVSAFSLTLPKTIFTNKA